MSRRSRSLSNDSAIVLTIATIIAVMALLLATAHAQTSAQPNVPCTCRYQGQDYNIGDSICLGRGTAGQMATCSMVLNNTSWQMSKVPCPQALLTIPEKEKIQQASPESPMSKPVF